MRARLHSWCLLIALGTAFAGAASGYYHFVRFNSRVGPYTAIPEKFDLTALPNKTVPFFISETGPVQLASNDSLAGVISQVRAAARVWNDVGTSDLRIAFGGMFSPGTPQSTPGIEVTFDDLPPGLVGLGGPTVKADTNFASSGAFVPIIRSVVVLPRNLAERPSFGERFFLSAVHEFGHTLGLQHTLTSSTMSTEVTRATTKARPLTADDIAGISLLYPTADFLANTGSISGRVTAGGQSVNLASVVAISPSGPAISALTNPDGTYRIDGIPPGQYYVYTHPLPPAVLGESTPNSIVYPVDSDGRTIPVSGLFDTVFLGGTKRPEHTVGVTAGAVVEDVNFAVTPKSTVTMFGVETYSFPAQVDVKPSFLSFSGPRSFIVIRGNGITTNGAPAPGLAVSAIGGSAVVQGVKPYAQDFLQVDFQLNSFAGEGPRHLIFSRGDDIYVLPSGLTVTQKQPPSITSISSTGDARTGRSVVLSGANLSADTRVLFDGVDAISRTMDDAGRLIATPPAAPLGYRANVVALNPDGQSSLFLQGGSPSSFNFDVLDTTLVSQNAPAVSVTPSALPAGSEAMIEINGSATSFADGQTRIGFGSSDIAVKRFWVVSPTKIVATLSIAPSAALFATTVSVSTGLQVVTQQYGFQVQSANPRLPVINSQLVNAATGRLGAEAGSPAVVTVSNLSGAPVQLTLNDTPLTVVSTSGNQITFQVPANVAPGYGILRLQAGTESALPVAVGIDPPAPVISLVQNNGTAVDGSRPARPGDMLTLTVAGLGDAGATIAPSRVRLTTGNVEHTILQIVPLTRPSGGHVVTFILSTATPIPASNSANLTIWIDGRPSLPAALPVRGL